MNNIYQRGATMWSTMSIIIMVGFIGYFGVVIGSIFIDHRLIRGAAQFVVDKPEFKEMSRDKIAGSIIMRLKMNNIRGFDQKSFKIERDKTGQRFIRLEYSPKSKLFSNIYTMVEFNEEIRRSL